MHAQPAMYRAVGLLIVQRLLYPLGTLDDIARTYAEDIMLHLPRCSAPHNSQLAQTLHSVRFPVLIASLELSTVPEDICASSVTLGERPLVLSRMRDVVEHVAERRRAGYTGYLFDLTDAGPDFAVLP